MLTQRSLAPRQVRRDCLGCCPPRTGRTTREREKVVRWHPHQARRHIVIARSSSELQVAGCATGPPHIYTGRTAHVKLTSTTIYAAIPQRGGSSELLWWSCDIGTTQPRHNNPSRIPTDGLYHFDNQKPRWGKVVFQYKARDNVCPSIWSEK